MPKTKLSSDNSERILEHGVGVMKGILAELGRTYDQLRYKALSMIGAQLIVAGFIFSDWDLKGFQYSTGEWIIFGMAIILQVVPLAIMMWILSPMKWPIPGDAEKYKNLNDKYDDYYEYLTVIHRDYDVCVSSIAEPVGKRAQAFTFVLYCLSLSVIILMVLKNGG